MAYVFDGRKVAPEDSGDKDTLKGRMSQIKINKDMTSERNMMDFFLENEEDLEDSTPTPQRQQQCCNAPNIVQMDEHTEQCQKCGSQSTKLRFEHHQPGEQKTTCNVPLKRKKEAELGAIQKALEAEKKRFDRIEKYMAKCLPMVGGKMEGISICKGMRSTIFQKGPERMSQSPRDGIFPRESTGLGSESQKSPSPHPLNVSTSGSECLFTARTQRIYAEDVVLKGTLAASMTRISKEGTLLSPPAGNLGGRLDHRAASRPSAAINARIHPYWAVINAGGALRLFLRHATGAELRSPAARLCIVSATRL
ncbi:unnamed protein product [Mytilus coruscus]|uniref:Uncharacterized protein n=1 Tax=Mytilus coruscus TaxID=42192 RepID=A0A6J8B6R6_MYTCO|nr:unnamed protein product [Mytilus coruscus]